MATNLTDDIAAAEEKLGKYIRIPREAVRGTVPPGMSQLPAASRAARIAEGDEPIEKTMRDYAANEGEDFIGLSGSDRNKIAAERQKISELADQYKRETRGTKDNSLRGKIRKVTGLKNGGSVSASRRGDGIAQRGKTKGRMC